MINSSKGFSIRERNTHISDIIMPIQRARSSPTLLTPGSHLRASALDSLRVLFHGRRRSSIRVSLSQHGIDGATKHFGVASVDLLLLSRFGVRVVVGHVVTSKVRVTRVNDGLRLFLVTERSEGRTEGRRGRMKEKRKEGKKEGNWERRKKAEKEGRNERKQAGNETRPDTRP